MEGEVESLLKHILESIVNNSEAIEIKKEVDELGILLRVWVAKEDMGLVIGRAGTTASAIKLIIKMAGYRVKSHVAVKIEEPSL